MKTTLVLFALVALGMVACGGGTPDPAAAADGAPTATPDVPADVPAGAGGAPAAPAVGGGAPAP